MKGECFICHISTKLKQNDHSLTNCCHFNNPTTQMYIRTKNICMFYFFFFNWHMLNDTFHHWNWHRWIVCWSYNYSSITLTPVDGPTRANQSSILCYLLQSAFKSSFVAITISAWNSLPARSVELDSPAVFKGGYRVPLLYPTLSVP